MPFSSSWMALSAPVLARLAILILRVTRELGVQIHSMCRSLSQFTDIACALVVGGNKNLKAQVCVCVCVCVFWFAVVLLEKVWPR